VSPFSAVFCAGRWWHVLREVIANRELRRIGFDEAPRPSFRSNPSDPRAPRRTLMDTWDGIDPIRTHFRVKRAIGCRYCMKRSPLARSRVAE